MFISIITINYNNKSGLFQTVKSVINQNFEDYEFVIIDGGSNDGSLEVINENRSFINNFLSEPDKGIYNAMNKGIKLANGEFVIFLNSGDTLFNNDVLSQVSRIISEDCDIYYGDLMIINQNGNRMATYPKNLSFSYFYNNGHLPHPASFIKRSLFERIGYYREDFKIAADWDFFIKAICKYNVKYCHMDIIISNYGAEGISSDPKHRNILLKEKKESLNSNFQLFLDDFEELKDLKSKFRLNRFKMLEDLESKRMTQRLNTMWFRILTFLFINKKKHNS